MATWSLARDPVQASCASCPTCHLLRGNALGSPRGKPRSSSALQASFPTTLLLEAPCALLPATPCARVSLIEPGRAESSHTELSQPSWHISEGKPCQEPVPVGLSDPWKPSQRAGSSRSRPTLFTKHRLCHWRGNWQQLLFLWMNLQTGSELGQASSHASCSLAKTGSHSPLPGIPYRSRKPTG